MPVTDQNTASTMPPGTDRPGGVPPQTPPPGPDPKTSFKAAAGNLSEASAYALQYASVQVDRTVATVRNVALTIALGVVAGVIALTVAVTAAALLVIGLAQAIAAAISGPPAQGATWHGNLIVGGGLCILTLVGIWLIIRFIKSAAFAATVRKYERMQQTQRDTLGHSADQRAAEQQSAPKAAGSKS